MSWLRIDDGFPSHPKFSGWTRAQKWALLELMTYCAKHKTGGIVPSDLDLLPRSITPALIAMAVDSGFVDVEDGVHVIHDWNYYNPSDSTGAQRQERFREKNRNARAVTKTVTSTVTEPSRTHARDPVPSPEAVTAVAVTAAERPRNELWDALTIVFGEASTTTAKSLRGKLVRSLAQAGATPDEILSRARSWPSHFDSATLTETALEKHWDALGRKPLRMAR